jgi:hypothetical protein
MNEKVLDRALEYWREQNNDMHRWASFSCDPTGARVVTGVIHPDGTRELPNTTRAFFLSVEGDVKSVTWVHL